MISVIGYAAGRQSKDTLHARVNARALCRSGFLIRIKAKGIILLGNYQPIGAAIFHDHQPERAHHWQPCN